MILFFRRNTISPSAGKDGRKPKSCVAGRYIRNKIKKEEFHHEQSIRQIRSTKKTDALERLSQLWNLTPANKALARSYLTDHRAEDSLLAGAERQIFPLLYSDEGHEVNQLLNKLAPPDQEKIHAKVLKLLWAIGGSTAGFVAIFDYNDITSSNAATDSVFNQRCEVLGSAAAAVMDAEYAAAVPTGFDQTARLHRLAVSDLDVLTEARNLIADPKTSMTDAVLTGVMLAAADPAKEKPCLLEKLFGMSSTSQWAKVERLLARTDDIVESASGSGLSSADIGNLKCYIHAGDTSVPVPDTKIPTAWQLPEQDIFNCRLADRTAVKCMAASVMFGLRHDNRMACALRVLADLNLCDVLQSILNFLPREWDISFLDTLLPHIPGGAVTVLRFAAKDLTRNGEKLPDGMPKAPMPPCNIVIRMNTSCSAACYPMQKTERTMPGWNNYGIIFPLFTKTPLPKEFNRP